MIRKAWAHAFSGCASPISCIQGPTLMCIAAFSPKQGVKSMNRGTAAAHECHGRCQLNSLLTTKWGIAVTPERIVNAKRLLGKLEKLYKVSVLAPHDRRHVMQDLDFQQ